MKKYILITVMLSLLAATPIYAQQNLEPELNATDEATFATDEADLLLASESGTIASPSAEEIEKLEIIRKEDITQPENPGERGEFFELFSRRPISSPTLFNLIAYFIQSAVRIGIPANTVILVLLLPLLATVIAFARHIIGLPTLGIIVPVALSITLLATGITAGALLLFAIVIGSIFARILLKRIRIMHMPKMSLSVFMVSIMVLVTLVLGASNGLLVVKQLSIFPVLLLILLSERIIALQIDRKLWETSIITLTNLGLGVAGFLILSSTMVRETVLLYPELTLLLVPINIAIGRYFGLRLTEYFRFKKVLNHGRK